jgi:tRNA nucleotidyltransferase/poly(A) polymerase
VGGCVRDCLLRRPLEDVDLVVAGDPWPLARRLARELGGAAFWLRKADRVARVAVPGGSGLSIDLAPLQGSLRDDLLARDLTVNALAIAAHDGLRSDAPLIDLVGGHADLVERRIRFTSPQAIRRDPLRALRAVRFRWQLGFRMAHGTGRQIRAAAPLLARVSAERIRDELFRMLETSNADRALADLIRYGLWGRMMPAPADLLSWNGRPAPVEALHRLRFVLAAVGRSTDRGAVSDVLDDPITGPRSRLALLRWSAALLGLSPAAGGAEPVDPSGMGARLRLSVRERQVSTHAVAGAPEAARLVARWPVAGSERLRLFQSSGDAGVEVVLLAGVLLGWSEALGDLLREAVQRRHAAAEPLLGGREVMELAGLSPGPRVGALLQELEEARADGVVNTPEQAREWVERRLRHDG